MAHRRGSNLASSPFDDPSQGLASTSRLAMAQNKRFR
jgi:hypothetical protein